MKAVDTNILARFFIDDPDDEQACLQRPIATTILSESVYVPITVILEFEWVMRGFYKLDRAEILHIYHVLLSFAHVQIEDHTIVLTALSYYQQGLDFADSLHAARSQAYDSFITFDVKFFKKAQQITTLNVELAKSA